MEWLIACHPDGTPLDTLTREEIHLRGLWHRVVHIWLVSRRADGWWVWFQQRSPEKQEFPGYFEMAASGHIDPGETPLAAALRETWEETGLRLSAHQLTYLGETREENRWRERIDRELCIVYLCQVQEPALVPGEEVQQMVRVPLAAVCHREQGGTEPVPAVNLAGHPLLLPCDGWCSHPGEFIQWVLPQLEE